MRRLITVIVIGASALLIAVLPTSAQTISPPSGVWTWPGSVLLAVSVQESGSGSVTTPDSYISCPLECIKPYDVGQKITLYVTATEGFTFAGWTGDACAGQGNPCTLTITADTSVTALFSGVYRPPAPPTSSSSSSSKHHQQYEYVFNPVADSYVDAGNPGTNFGSNLSLRVDGSPVLNGYLRFVVGGTKGNVTGATLRVYANSAGVLGYQTQTVSDNSWAESGITYNNAPAVGSVIGASGAFTGGNYTEVDVSSYVNADGTYSFALTTSSATQINLASRESGNPPQLVVETRS
jgi:uncharacterized repeat protein (TIGR02543 family)